MPNDTEFTGLQSVQIANCEAKEDWPKYNKDLKWAERKRHNFFFSIITVSKTCKLGKMARTVGEILGEMISGSNLDNIGGWPCISGSTYLQYLFSQGCC